MAFKLGDQGPAFREFQLFLNRKFAAYSHIKIDERYGLDEAAVVAEAMRRYHLAPTFMDVILSGVKTRVEGAIATDEFLTVAKYNPPTKQRKYPIQGVGGDSSAFFMPPQAHSYNRATNGFAMEAVRLTNLVAGDIVPVGWSMGGDSVRKYLTALRPDQQARIKAVITFGDPSMPDRGSLLSDDPGRGISGMSQPQWCWDRYWSFSADGDWYPRARGLLFLAYEVLTRAELTLDFAWWLFTSFPTRLMQELMGLQNSDDPLAGILSFLPPLITSGPSNSIGTVLNPQQILGVFMLGVELIELIIDAVKFIQSNAHFRYNDPSLALWDGMSAVDYAVSLVREHVPNGATTMLFPGTGGNWDQGPPFDTAIRLYG